MRLAYSLAFCLAAPWAAPAATLYVAPTGSDLNPGTAAAPLASLAGARDAVRRLKAAGPLTAPVDVVFADGTYPLPAVVRFTPLDSGTAAAPVRYQAAPGAKPILSGGVPIRGWQRTAGGLWQTRVPEVAAGWYFEQLYLNGRRATRARTPNEFWHHVADYVPSAVNPATGQAEDTTRRGFLARSADFAPLANLPADRLSDVGVVFYHSWESGRHRLGWVDPARRLIVTAGPAAWELDYWKPTPLRYHLENLRSALDEPGEWYLDRDGTLLYLPLPGEDPATTVAVAPRTPGFLKVVGDGLLGLTVDHLTFRGLSFQHAAYTLPALGHSDGQAECTVPNAIELDGARQVRFEQCEVAHIGQHAICFHEACRDNAVVGCYLWDLGGGGVRIGHWWDNNNPTAAQLTSHTLVDNNIIRGGGRLHHGSHGVWIGGSADNQVTHNEISDFNYSGISVGWRWGYAPSVAKRNRVDSNHIHHLGWGMLSDMGGIYTLGPSEGTTLNDNVMHDIYSYDLFGRGGWGLYNDEGSTGIVMQRNIVYRTKTGGYHLHYGKDLTIQNNVFVDSLTFQLQHSRDEEHHQYDFLNNIVAWRAGDLFQGRWTVPQIRLANNVYWPSAGQPFSFGGLTQAQWQAGGRDAGSLVADPQFVDPDHDDYRVKPTSPAVRLGFQRFEPNAGVYGDPAWVALARSVTYPAVEFAPDPPTPSPLRLSLDFEHEAMGAKPSKAVVYTENHGDSVAVSAEQAAGGRQALKVQDAPGLKFEYNPHFYWDPVHLDGVTTIKFDLRLGPGALLYCEGRDSSSPYRVGPSVWIRNQAVQVPGHPALALPLERWVQFEIRIGLGTQSTGTWELSVTVPGQAPQVYRGLRNGDPAMKTLRWLGFSSSATTATTWYLDNLSIETSLPVQ
ncbi:MAG: right-handed parallel beta-helix repeat-containing protein [Chloroflexi bacterium]|nr:right-handed parallel beta-helix repeat-containing protein [Chloroflexota bacterium]